MDNNLKRPTAKDLLRDYLGDPISLLLERWHAGDEAAAEEIYRRYAERLWALARSRIGQRLGSRIDAEDVVQSVFRTFFRRARSEPLVLDQSDSLWRMLVRLTLHKVGRQARQHQAGRRDMAAESHSLDDGVHPEAVAHEPTPVEAAILADELETTLVGLDDSMTAMFRLGLQGHSSAEIAQQLGCSRWTVRRVLDRIGHQLMQRLDAENSENL